MSDLVCLPSSGESAAQVCVRVLACRDLKPNKKTQRVSVMSSSVYVCFPVLKQCDIVSYHTLGAAVNQ